MPFSRIKEPVTPDELALLQSVFDELCLTNGLSKHDEDAEALGLILVSQLQNGVKDPAMLRSIAQNILRHQAS